MCSHKFFFANEMCPFHNNLQIEPEVRYTASVTMEGKDLSFFGQEVSFFKIELIESLFSLKSDPVIGWGMATTSAMSNHLGFKSKKWTYSWLLARQRWCTVRHVQGQPASRRRWLWKSEKVGSYTYLDQEVNLRHSREFLVEELQVTQIH